MSTRLRPVALSLAAMLALAGCSAPAQPWAPQPQALLGQAGAARAGLASGPADLTTPASAPRAATPAAAPTVTSLSTPAVRVQAGSPAAPVAAQPAGYLRVLGHAELSREELRDDAEEGGYRVQSSVSVPSVTGYVRRSSGTSYLLEARRNHLGVKTTSPTAYTLKTSDEAIRGWLAQHVNDKVNVKGLFAADNSVTVTFADKALDLGFLTDWWTKGKLRGTIVGADGLPLVNVEVKARSSAGYVFLGNTDDTGAFTLKSLAPGDYQIWLSKVGYGVVSRLIEVKAHQATEVEGKLYRN